MRAQGRHWRVGTLERWRLRHGGPGQPVTIMQISRQRRAPRQATTQTQYCHLGLPMGALGELQKSICLWVLLAGWTGHGQAVVGSCTPSETETGPWNFRLSVP